METVNTNSAEKSNKFPSFGKLHFLIVDDEEFNLFLLKNILTKWGVTYLEAVNGKEAVEVALNHSFDLILLDLRMPVMDGYEAAKVILKNHPFSKIIALTGTMSPVEAQKIDQAGMLGYLQKPFTESSLFEAVSKSFPSVPNENAPIELTGSPPVSLDDLKRMTGGDQAFFNEMLNIFIRSSENGLSSIQASFKCSDWDAVSVAAHKLAAPSKHLNASILYDDLKKLESEAENQRDIAEIEKLITSIEHEISLVNAFLKQLLSEV